MLLALRGVPNPAPMTVACVPSFLAFVWEPRLVTALFVEGAGLLVVHQEKDQKALVGLAQKAWALEQLELHPKSLLRDLAGIVGLEEAVD